MHLDCIHGRPRVYPARGGWTFYTKGRRFVITDAQLRNQDALARAVEAAPTKHAVLATTFTIIGETLANAIGQHLAPLVPRRRSFALMLCGLAAQIITIVFTGIHRSPIAPMTIIPAILVLCLWHEFGHAAAAARTGIRNDGMGAGFFLIFPVLATRVSMIATLDQQDRITVLSAGVLFQAYAAAMLGAWFAATGSTLAATLFVANCFVSCINLVPLFGYDGARIASEFIDQLGTTTQRLEPALAVRLFNRLTLFALIALAIHTAWKNIAAITATGPKAGPIVILALIAFSTLRIAQRQLRAHRNPPQ